MAKPQLNRMVAQAAWEELQEAYKALPEIKEGDKDLEKVELHMGKVNDWLVAMKTE